MLRYEKAEADLARWRETRDALVRHLEVTDDLRGAVRAVDAAFKGEVTESRIRKAVASQVLNEANVCRLSPDTTPTGQHLWDFDWWLTEATMRAIHAGVDATAQVLNTALAIGVDRDTRGLPEKVYEGLKARPELTDLTCAVECLWCSPECRSIAAFVNHVKHVGFPQRGALAMSREYDRSTTVEAFSYDGVEYGPWNPSDVDALLDGLRLHLQSVLDQARTALEVRAWDSANQDGCAQAE
jgi:hypothetical protein